MLLFSSSAMATSRSTSRTWFFTSSKNGRAATIQTIMFASSSWVLPALCSRKNSSFLAASAYCSLQTACWHTRQRWSHALASILLPSVRWSSAAQGPSGTYRLSPATRFVFLASLGRPKLAFSWHSSGPTLSLCFASSTTASHESGLIWSSSPSCSAAGSMYTSSPSSMA